MMCVIELIITTAAAAAAATATIIVRLLKRHARSYTGARGGVNQAA